MAKNIFETEQYKFKLLAADKYCYTHIIDILKENIKEFKFNKTNDNIEKLITRKPILELLFVNPYFQDEEKYNLLKILKDNLDLIKKNMTFYFDYTSVIFNTKEYQKKFEKELFTFKDTAFADTISIELGIDMDDKKQFEFLTIIKQLEKMFTFKEYYKEKELPLLDEQIRKNIEIMKRKINQDYDLIRIFSKYKYKDPNNFSFFKFLSEDWFKNIDENIQNNIKENVLKVIEYIPLCDEKYKNSTKTLKKEILSHLYTHIKIADNFPFNFDLEPNEFLNSINTIENEKYRNKMLKKRKSSNTMVLGEYRTLSNEFETYTNKMFFYEQANTFIDSEYDLFEAVKEIEPNIKNNHSLDFIFKRKDFDLKFFINQFKEIGLEFVDARNNHRMGITTNVEQENNALLKYSKFLSFSFENIYLMQELYEKNQNLFNSFIYEYNNILTYPVKKSNIYSDHHFIYTRFNVNNFLQMNEKFKETYLNILGKLILTNPETRMQGLHNFFQIFNKEPELSSFLIKELEKINQFSDENFKDIQKYIFEVDKYFQIYKNIYYDKNPELEIEIKNAIENYLKNNDLNYPNIQI